LPPNLLQTILGIHSLTFEHLCPSRARYTSFHPMRDLLPPSPCTSPGMAKYRYCLLGTPENPSMQLLCTHRGP
jgi:hypothetical protein